MALIEARNLKKQYRVNVKRDGLAGAIFNLVNPRYQIKEAVKGISFLVDQTEMIGYIGANGAGKSTTIKMLTGILTPTSGEVIVDGLVPNANRIKNNMKIGVVFGQRTQMWWDIPVIESYKLIQKIYEVPIDTYKRNLKWYAEYLDINDLLKTPVRQLSLGQKMRCEIAAAFIHEPKIVFLDEPTIGLDFLIKEKIREFIRTVNKEKGITVFLTTHDLRDIEEISHRLIILDKGKIIHDGKIDEIRNTFNGYSTAHFRITNPMRRVDDLFSDVGDKVKVMSQNLYSVEIKFNKNTMSVARLIDTMSPHCNIIDVSIHEPSIETIVKNLYGEKAEVEV